MLSRHPRLILLLFGILVVSAGGILVASASQTTLITAERALSDYWRTSYDILVRPAGSRSPIEEKYSLVEPNHLSGIWGGITFEQYEAIKAIPGVEVAAPIAMIGYVPAWAFGESMGLPYSPGVYLIEETMMINDGCRIRTILGSQPQAFNYYDSERSFDPYEYNRILRESGIVLLDRPRLGGGVPFPILMAGIDPLQEAVLVPLDQSILQGRYLRLDESLKPKITVVPLEGYEGRPIQQPINLPILINATTYVDLLYYVELKHIVLPQEVASLEEILARGGTTYLETLPVEDIAKTQMDSQAIYQRMIELITPKVSVPGQIPSAEMLLGAYAAWSTPSHLVYQESTPPFRYEGLALALQLPSGREGQTFPKYRASLAPGEAEFDIAYYWDVIGVFDIKRIPRPAEVSNVPLETYFPPIAILRYDEQGIPVESPCTLLPTLSAEGYIQPPPLVLTTLDAAHALRGDSAISAIRVRVSDVEQLTPANQRKIEAIAIEIQRQTGLDVDIMVGSSPTRVLVHVPEIGYVEEQWIHKGVNLIYKSGIQTGNWLLMGTLLLAGALFTLDMAWAEVLSRRRVIALQKALGWRSRTVFTQIVGQVVMIGAIATLTGTLIALALIRLLEWESIPLNLLIALPVIVIVLCAVGSLLPAWSASRVPPVAELQRGGVQYQSNKHTAIVSALWSYAWSEIRRRRVRSVLTGMGSALSAALLTLLLGVTLQQRGMLGGTLLGEFILVNVQGYHYAIVAIGLGLAFLSTFNGLLGSILERRREIGVLKAVGWRTVSVARLFILQGILLGIVGGFVGALVGVLAFLYFYQSVSTSLALAFVLGICTPGLVGALAALYPARLAAHVPPAEAVRYE